MNISHDTRELWAQYFGMSWNQSSLHLPRKSNIDSRKTISSNIKCSIRRLIEIVWAFMALRLSFSLLPHSNRLATLEAQWKFILRICKRKYEQRNSTCHAKLVHLVLNTDAPHRSHLLRCPKPTRVWRQTSQHFHPFLSIFNNKKFLLPKWEGMRASCRNTKKLIQKVSIYSFLRYSVCSRSVVTPKAPGAVCCV